MIKGKFLKHHTNDIFIVSASCFGSANCLIYKTLTKFIAIYICRQLSVFPSNSGRICPKKQEIAMLFCMNNTFQQNSVFNEVDWTWIPQVFLGIPGNFQDKMLFQSHNIFNFFKSCHSVNKARSQNYIPTQK